ncbi:20996_t:CDS:1, partial [Dentiscutata erythropus]
EQARELLAFKSYYETRLLSFIQRSCTYEYCIKDVSCMLLPFLLG